jgi:hypothetical protein
LTILTLITTGFRVLQALLDYAQRKELMDAGEAMATAELLRQGSIKIEQAIAARRSVKHDPVSVSLDPNNRD